MKRITFDLKPGSGSVLGAFALGPIERYLARTYDVQPGSVVIEDVPDPVEYEEKQFLVIIKAALPNGVEFGSDCLVEAIEERFWGMFGEKVYDESIRHTVEVEEFTA